MSTQVDLIWLGNDTPLPNWPLGAVWTAAATPPAVHDLVHRRLATSSAQAWLFWHADLGAPDPDRIFEILARPGQVWHAGLRLGMGGLPGIGDFVSPTWMLNCDPAMDIEATSWRLSLSACLVQTEVLRQMGSVFPEFQTLDGAALEMGHRYVIRGVLVRHVPDMLAIGALAALISQVEQP